MSSEIFSSENSLLIDYLFDKPVSEEERIKEDINNRVPTDEDAKD